MCSIELKLKGSDTVNKELHSLLNIFNRLTLQGHFIKIDFVDDFLRIRTMRKKSSLSIAELKLAVDLETETSYETLLEPFRKKSIPFLSIDRNVLKILDSSKGLDLSFKESTDLNSDSSPYLVDMRFPLRIRSNNLPLWVNTFNEFSIYEDYFLMIRVVNHYLEVIVDSETLKLKTSFSIFLGNGFTPESNRELLTHCNMCLSSQLKGNSFYYIPDERPILGFRSYLV